VIATERPPDTERPPVQDWRCRHCGRLLARMRLGAGSLIVTRCPKCGDWVTLEVA
jgi:phage FluMu protein Com